jgi:hypothetical protein
MVSNKDYHHYPTEHYIATFPVAKAEVLPDNWSRHTAPVVQLAVAQAMLLVEESYVLAVSGPLKLIVAMAPAVGGTHVNSPYAPS